MTIFDRERVTQSVMHFDMDGLRRGFYSDKYFANIVRILEGARADGYHFAGNSPRSLPQDAAGLDIGDLIVEAQVFNRRSPVALVAGVDAALSMLRHATGFFEGEQFVETWHELDVEALEDGVFTSFAGDTEDVDPVIIVRGRYRDFALLETTVLGVLTRASRIATNVYNVLTVANGKSVLFFPARFDLPAVQPIDGYAYRVAIERYNADFGVSLSALVSTDAQAAWWGGQGSGTVPHALIACFLADTAEAMMAFARYISPEVSRVALVDFNNDSVTASLSVLNAYWPHYQAAWQSGDTEAQKRYTLYGVRLDTSGNMRDVSLGEDDPTGVNPVLVRAVRTALDGAWESWQLPSELVDVARSYCNNVKIVVSGGFNREKIERFEREEVPVDIYGVGSTFLQNDSATNTDYTMDIVRVKIAGEWVDMPKVGRKPDANPHVSPVDLTAL